MYTTEAAEEYALALKHGLKEVRECNFSGVNSSPEVLDELLPEIDTHAILELGLVDIPSERIVGTMSAGRISAFSPAFCPC